MTADSSCFNHCLQVPAWCPACGEQALRPDSDKSLQCQSCGFLYYHNVAATSSAFIETPDGFLMVYRAHDPHCGMLDLPGGFIEKHETAETALHRELREELGLVCEPEPQYLCSFNNRYHYAGIDYDTIDLYFLIRLENRPAINSNEELAGHVWLKPDQIPVEQIGFESVKNACAFYKNLKPGIT
ncbi:MAG: NUDIX domain-containing protein [Gammaproteobacteria bacterium]|nr:NUDIX domain-containing protein [Gammaproteobacteria bacterium]